MNITNRYKDGCVEQYFQWIVDVRDGKATQEEWDAWYETHCVGCCYESEICMYGEVDIPMLDKFRGCLIGGGAGDALGYTVEFMKEAEIFGRYGREGITPAAVSEYTARISDDTQMTLFTASGLIEARRGGVSTVDDYRRAIAAAYLEWLYTQNCFGTDRRRPEWGRSWLLNVSGMYRRRAPGGTCLTALGSGRFGSVAEAINGSKGCGGVMRVAPVGLYFEDAVEAAQVAAEAAAVTHGHSLGHMPAAALAAIVSDLAYRDATIPDAVDHALEIVEALYTCDENLPVFVKLMQDAVYLAGRTDVPDLQAIHILGEGWVGEEALAVAVYCALRHPDDFNAAIIAAVNHNGDSDSTGAVCGNIVGAHLGLSKMPEDVTDNLELCDVILKMAGELHDAVFTVA